MLCLSLQWENHSNSMKLEAQTLAKIKGRINEKVMNSCGTWIDWQYLLDAAALLAKCRYTLQYTYPYAYYMEASNRKKLVRNIFSSTQLLCIRMQFMQCNVSSEKHVQRREHSDCNVYLHLDHFEFRRRNL